MPKETGAEFERGSLVWAHLKGYKHWPAVIVSHPREEKRPSFKHVLFFGTKNYAWINKKELLSFAEHYERFTSDLKNAKFRAAVKAAEIFRTELSAEFHYAVCNEAMKERIRVHLLVTVSNEAMKSLQENDKKARKEKMNAKDEGKEKEAKEKENTNQKLSRKKKAPGESLTQSVKALKKPKASGRQEPKRAAKAGPKLGLKVSKKPKMHSLPKFERKESKRAAKNGPKLELQVPKKPKMHSLPKHERKEPKRTGKQATKKADFEDNTCKRNLRKSCRAANKPKIADPTKDRKRGAKRSERPEATNKTAVEKNSSKRKSTEPRNAAEQPKMSASAPNLRPRRILKPQVMIKKSKICYMKDCTSTGFPGLRTSSRTFETEIYQPAIKKSRICYMPPSGPSSIYACPSTSFFNPETTNGRPVYDGNLNGGSWKRGPFQPVPLVLGFVGIGELATLIVSNLLRAGTKIYIWNRTVSKCDDLVKLGAIRGKTAEDVAVNSDIVFATVRGMRAIAEVCFGGYYCDLNGIVAGLKKNPRKDKGFVMMSTIMPDTSLIIAQDFRDNGADYVEAQVIKNSQSKFCDIKVLCAGDKELFEKLPRCFSATKAQFIYVNRGLGEASRMKYAYTLTRVGYILSLIEALAVLKESQRPVESLFAVLSELDNISPVMRNKFIDIIFRRRDPGDTIRELKETLRELHDWYPGRTLKLATTAYNALCYGSRRGATRRSISALYDLLV